MEPCDLSQPPRLFGPGARLHPSHGLAYRRSRGLAHLRRFEARSPAGPSRPPRPALPATPPASPAMLDARPFAASNGHTELPVKATQRTQIGNGSRQRAQGHKPSPMDRRQPGASPGHCRLSGGPGRPQPASPSSTQPIQRHKQAIDTGRARHNQPAASAQA